MTNLGCVEVYNSGRGVLMRAANRAMAMDSVCRVSQAAQNDDLAKSLNTLRTVPGAPNPFVASQGGMVANQGVTPPATPPVDQSSSR